MSQLDEFDRSLARWFDTEPRPTATADVLDRALRATQGRRPRPRLFAALGSHWLGDGVGATSGGVTLGRTGVRTSMVLIVLLLVLALVAAAVLVGGRLLQPAPVDLGIFEPVAGRIVYGDEDGIWGVDPAAPEDPATTVRLTSEAGSPLGWSSDGTRLLIARGSPGVTRLFILHADGSETQLSERPGANAVAAISPDGRVVFWNGLYAVDATGGPAEMLREDPGAWAAAFSPDGTRIAYVVGPGDHSNSVWLMDADGSNAHQIVSNESDDLPGHVRGLAWSPAGDRLALGLGGKIYTFAPDGSDFTQIAGGDTSCAAADPCSVKLLESAESPYWSPDGSQIAYTTGCIEGAGAANRSGCHLAIADADGSNVRTFGIGVSGPWHPGVSAIDDPVPSPATTEPAGQLMLYVDSWQGEPNAMERGEVAVYVDGRVIWGAGELGGYLVQRLTPEGLELLRSRALSTGLFERDLLATAIGDLVAGIDVVGSGYIKVLRGDRPVIVAWGRTPELDVSGHGPEDRWERASSAQAADITELDQFLRNPTTWGLTDDMYIQREITAFVPSHFWISWDRGTPDWSELPAPAREVVTRYMDGCPNISLDQAREIAQVLMQAGVPTDYDDRLGLSFSMPSSFVHTHPALPHDSGTACGEG